MLGKAANRVPEDLRNQYPDLPWFQMITVRNHLLHGYVSVDFDILWVIIQTDLPVLIIQLEEILGSD